MRKDVFISFAVHITLVILILFFLPTSSNTRGYPTIYNVGLVSMPKGMGKGGGSKAPSEVSAEMKRIEEGVGLKQIMKEKEEKGKKKKSIEEEKLKEEKGEKSSGKMGEGKGGPGSGSDLKFGEGVGGAQVEGGEFAGGDYYIDIMRARISEYWKNPIRGATAVIRTTIFYEIMKDGRIKDAKIETSSGFELFDQAALRAVLSTNPLPPLPREYTGKSLGVHLEFEYSP
jgi:TonB family protein